MDDVKQKCIDAIQAGFPQANPRFSEFKDELTVEVEKQHITAFCAFLKSLPDFEFVKLEDITAIDWATRTNRFTVVYFVFSLLHNFRLKIKAAVDEKDCDIDSVASVWKAASWYEREVYDMYGISFAGHSDLRRMYMPEEFEYHPLRKDFPLMGVPGSLPLPKNS